MELFVKKAKDVWAQLKPMVQKIGPNGAWFVAGFAAAKLLSCLAG